MIKNTFSIVIAFFIIFLSVAQNNHPDTINNRIWKQTCLLPNEKIHLHTDRSLYAGGDTIWFKAYLVNALDNKQETESRYIYSELIDPFGKNVCRVRIKQDKNAQFYGYLPIDNEIQAGQYAVRAYTRYMENAGEEFFFHKPVLIVSPLSKSLSTEISLEGEPGQKQIKSKPANDYQVDFLPEGGNVPAGVLSKMAFKALNTTGLSEEISGTVKDETGKTICSFQTTHIGMGSFNWTPEAGQKYYAECVSKAGVKKRFELPAIETNTCTLNVQEDGYEYHISILYPNGIATNETQTLLIHQRGFPLLVQPFRQTHQISIEKKVFSPGIIHILLLSSQSKIISERQVFIQPDKQATAHIQTNKEAYTPRDKVRQDITLQDAEGTPVRGNFSIAITDNTDVLPDSCYTIYTSLLLSSDLKGYIEDPGWYFREDDNTRKEGLDLLMLTQGWRKYNVENALEANYKQPAILPETSQRIAGSVKRLVGNKAIANAKIQIHIPTERVLEEIHAGEDGWFEFDSFEFPDSTIYNIQATTNKNGRNVLLSLDPEIFPKADQIWPLPSYSFHNATNNANFGLPATVEFLNKANRRITYENGMRNIFLEDVVVTAKKRKIIKTPYETVPGNISVRQEDIEQAPMMDLKQLLLSRFPGLYFVENTQLYYRQKPVRIVLNEFPVNDATMEEQLIQILNMKDIEQIDFNRNEAAGLAWFPMTGAYFIAIKTKQDVSTTNYTPNNIKQIRLLGFQKPTAFYSPKYETPQQKNSETPDLRTTIYWNPTLQTNRQGKTSVEFYTADGNTTYSVVIEGVTQKNELVRTVEKIIVRE